MDDTYVDLSWVDSVTSADATNLNNLEQGVLRAHRKAAAHPGYDYTVLRSGNTYTGLRADGTIHTEATDSGTPTSGLRAVMNAIAAHGVSIFFPAGIYSFPEDPAGVEDHWAMNDIHDLTLQGVYGQTILSNWRDDTIGGYDTNADTEPFSFTRAHGLKMDGFVIWHGGNPDANASCDAMDFDGSEGIQITNNIVMRSRARGIIFDAGDQGGAADRSIIANNKVIGIPPKPAIWTVGGSSMTMQEYRYVVTYVDSKLGETQPSDVAIYVGTNTQTNRIQVPIGPSYDATRGVTARKIYRWSTAQQSWRLLTTINNNTTTTWDDNASDASIAANALLPTNGVTLIPAEGIKMLGGENCLIQGNTVWGVDGHGIQTARKGSGTGLRAPKGISILGNLVRFAGKVGSGKAGIMTAGGDRHLIEGNQISACGSVGNNAYGIYLQGLTGCTTEYNMIGSNVVYDLQTAASPSGGASMHYAVGITGTPAPNVTTVAPLSAQGMITGLVNNAGTATKNYNTL